MSSQSQSQSHNKQVKSSIKKNQKIKNTQNSLAKQILKVLSQKQINHHSLITTHSSTPLKLKIIQKKPIYVADEEHCIIAAFRQAPKISLNPCNRLSTEFYAGHSKPHIVFNCKDQTIEQQINQFPSCYHPAFHYKNYQQFKQKRKTSQILVSCQRIQVKSWSIAIVNVSLTGYYAPILILHQYKKIHQNAILESAVQNIIFFKELGPILQNFRLKDLRRILLTHEKDLSCFSFYMRNQVSTKKKAKTSQFVTVDLKGSLLSNNQNVPINFIPLGSIYQYEIFKRPVPPKFLTKKKQINLRKFNFNQLIDPNQCDQSNSSFQEFEAQNQEQRNGQNLIQENIGKNRMIDQHQQDLSESDASSQQDYLKQVYRKKIEKNNETII